MIKINKKSFLIITIFTVLFFAFSYLKFSFGLGSHKFFFSGINFLVPVVGAFLSLPVAVIFVGILFFIKKIALGGLITFGLPTVIATITFSLIRKQLNQQSFLIEMSNFFFRVILPVMAIFLFVLHPIGQQAFIYSFYWLIPISLYFLQKFNIHNSIFAQALTTTFIAHAVGSVMWLYFIPMTSVQWISLIPIVAVERLVFVSGISLIHLVIGNVLDRSYYFSKEKNNITNL